MSDVTAPKIPDWLAAIFPFEPRSFRTPGGALMSYVDEGPRAEEAVLMLHGNPTWSFYYRRLITSLSGQVRCIVPDHVGMGLSEKPQTYDYTLASRIRDVEALVESLGVRKVHLVVHDWGGAVGFGFAARHPELIGRLVVMNTAAFPSKRIPVRIAVCRTPLLGKVIVRGLNGFAGPATRMAMHRRSLSADEKRGYLYPYGSWADRVAVHGFVRDIPMQRSHSSYRTLDDVASGLKKFRNNPALILWGGQDFCFNDSFLDEWKNRLPQAAVEYLKDAGHYVLEDAAETAVPRIAGFLSV
jgi:pimeloyl-ACP methyl ester carboxylesterase